MKTTLTTLPGCPAATSRRATSCVQCMTDSRLARQRACQPLGALSRNGATKTPPALLTSTSTGPRCAAVASSAAATASGSRASAGTASASPPALAMPAAVRPAVSGSRSSTATRAPKRAITRAIPRPMPAPAPVTSAVRPSSEALRGSIAERSARRVGDEHALAAAKALAKALRMARPAFRVLGGEGRHQPRLDRGILDQLAGRLEARPLRRPDRDPRAGTSRLDAFDAPRGRPGADVHRAAVDEEPDLRGLAERATLALGLDVDVARLTERLLQLGGERPPRRHDEGDEQGPDGNGATTHGGTLSAPLRGCKASPDEA